MQSKLWLWRNFVDGKPEYLAFDNPYPCYVNGDPMTIGEPCGYAFFKSSENGRPGISDDEVVSRMVGSLKPKRAI